VRVSTSDLQAPGRPVTCLDRAGQPREFMRIATAPSGVVVAGELNGTVVFWNDAASLDEEPAALGQHPEHVTAVDVSADGHWAASACFDGAVILWDLRARRPAWKGTFSSPAIAVRFSPDSTRLGWENGDAIALLSIETKEIEMLPTSPPLGDVCSLAWSPDSRRIVAADREGGIGVWSVSGKSLEYAIKGSTAAVLCLAFAPDGRTCCVGRLDGRLQVFDADSGEPLGEIRAHRGATRVAHFSGSDRIVTGGYDGAVRIWDARTLQSIRDDSQEEEP
jgi:WD40 repeat protein